jgi:hypothetical protein
MEDVKIILSGLWVAVMLTFLWGDVLNIFSGEVEKTFGDQSQMTQGMWLGIAILMMIPIVMVVLSLTTSYPLNRWTNIIVAIFWFGFNLLSLKGYSTPAKFLLIVSMGFNLLTVWNAWNWVIK